MTATRPAFHWRQLFSWLWDHRPLAWLERCLGSFESWRPDPPVMDRLIR